VDVNYASHWFNRTQDDREARTRNSQGRRPKDLDASRRPALVLGREVAESPRLKVRVACGTADGGLPPRGVDSVDERNIVPR